MFLTLALAAAASPLQTTLAPLIDPAIEAEAVHGIVLGVVTPEGQEVMSFGGLSPSASLEIGSVSKGITGLLLAEALRRGEVELSDAAADHLPFSLPTHEKHPIRVGHLAMHTSGLPRMPMGFEPADPQDPYRDVDDAKFAAFASAAVLEGEPGTHYAYSNLGAALLGRVLVEAAGKPYATLVEERLTTPLGMKHTTVDGSKLIAGHDVDGEPVPPWSLGAFAPAGAVESTAGDMLRLVSAAMDPKSPLTPTFQLATQQHESLGTQGGIGLGWHLTPSGMVWHNGQTGGFHSLVAFLPSRGIGVVVLSDTASPLVDDMGFSVMEVLAGQQVPVPEIQAPVAVPTKTLEGYVGTWGPAKVFTRDSKLFLQLEGQPAVRMWPSSPTEFFLRAAPANARFRGDSLEFSQQGVPDQTWGRK